VNAAELKFLLAPGALDGSAAIYSRRRAHERREMSAFYKSQFMTNSPTITVINMADVLEIIQSRGRSDFDGLCGLAPGFSMLAGAVILDVECGGHAVAATSRKS